jgi:anti-sigma-K factor RskA
MGHCTPDELMDVVETARAEASLPHLSTCAVCRQQLTDLRAVLAEVRELPVPEPSPMQWARLSARVRDAVASEPSRSPWWASWGWRLPVAAAAVLTLAVLVPGMNRTAPRPAVAGPGVAVVDQPGGGVRVAQVADDAREDPSLGLMFDLAAVVDFDSDPAPVFAMGAGTLEAAVGDLSPDEQHELERLLNEAIGRRPGA